MSGLAVMLAPITVRVGVRRYPRSPPWPRPFPITSAQCLGARTATTSTVTPVADKDQPSSRIFLPFPSQSLTVLHKTSALLPRVLPPDSSKFWTRVLAGAYDDLTSPANAAVGVRVVVVVHFHQLSVLTLLPAVYGVGPWQLSGAHDLVSALLLSPFASDPADNVAIRSRWKDHGDKLGLIIQHRDDEQLSVQGQDRGLPKIPVQSPYLLGLPAPIQITEIRTPTSITPTFHATNDLDEEYLAILLKADIPIIVCNPLTTPLTTLPTILRDLAHPNTMIVFTTPPSPDLVDPIQSLFCRQRPDESHTQRNSPKILFVDPQRALSAIDALESDPASPTAVQRFQHDLLGSQVSSLIDAIRMALFSASEMSGSDAARSQTAICVDLKTHTAHAQARSALRACSVAVVQAEKEVQEIRGQTSKLRGRVEEARATVHREAFLQPGSSTSSNSGADVDVVQKALADAELEMSVVMRRLTWWRMVWRVDEIETVVSDALRMVWCRDLEKHLVFHSGRLAALQESLTSATYALLDAIPPTSALASPILRNTLAQLRTTPTSPLSPTSLALTAPINTRRAQLTQHPTVYLHRAAQHAVLGMGGGAVTGAGLCWAGVSAVMTGTEFGTAVAAAVFGALAGLRWGIGMWERGVRRWWADWGRVGEGLNRDLKMALEVSIDEVVKVAKQGCDGLEVLAKKREWEVEGVKEEMEKLEETLKSIRSPC